MEFNFENMAQLAKDDPKKFALCREYLIRQLVSQSCQSKDLAALQMHLDSMRYSCAQGLQSAEVIVEMMYDAITTLTTALATLNQVIETFGPLERNVNANRFIV